MLPEDIQQYINKGIKLIGVYSNGAVIARGKEEIEKAYTNDAEEIEALMHGNGDKHGNAKGTRISCFRFVPADYEYIVIDIDRHEGKEDGLENFYTWLQKQGLSRGSLPMYLRNIDENNQCYVRTKRGGYHLYFKCPNVQNIKFENNPADSVECLVTKPVTIGGSCMNGQKYRLFGRNETRRLENAHALPKILLEILRKKEPETKPTPKQSVPVTLQKSRQSATYDRDRLKEEMKKEIRRYLELKGMEITKQPMTLCPFHDDHNPSAIVNEDSIHCFSDKCDKKSFDIYDVSMKLNNCDFKTTFEEVRQMLGYW
ncbi:CHC2 zinc finger domain-containing protein [Candidatus Endomicrobiellum agilis]|uniref:CHC2 zinc finger domain-containing protein n=1 Tax=Candidatus Endomicrobiellum agilis TaxID=3238957 RepID=UPI00357BAF6C|nr:bifunctional DNA primase/polymerase [Endomicrobium sp.]